MQKCPTEALENLKRICLHLKINLFLLGSGDLRWEGMTSAILVVWHVVARMPREGRGGLVTEALTSLLPWTLLHHHGTRTIAQLVILVSKEKCMCLLMVSKPRHSKDRYSAGSCSDAFST